VQGAWHSPNTLPIMAFCRDFCIITWHPTTPVERATTICLGCTGQICGCEPIEPSRVSNKNCRSELFFEIIILIYLVKNKFTYRVVTSARSCNKVGHLFWFTILAQHETDEVILYIHNVHKHRGNSFKLQNYKMRLKQIRLNWINSMQVKKILFTNVFSSWSLCLLNMF
jgi:hypothetical protein